MNKSQALLEALAAGNVDAVLVGTEYDSNMVFMDSEGKRYTGADNLLDIDYSKDNAARVTTLLAVLDDVGGALEGIRMCVMSVGISDTESTKRINDALATITKAKEMCRG